MSAAPPEPRKETKMESSSNSGHIHRIDSPEVSERTERIRKLEARLKESEQKTLDEIAETTNVTMRLKEKLETSADTSRLKIRKTKLETPVVDISSPTPPPLPKPQPSGVRPAASKNGVKP